METSGPAPTPDEAAAALLDATTARDQLSNGLVLPSWFHTSIGLTIVAQIATAAVGVAAQTTSGLVLVGGGLVPCLVVACVQLVRFRRLNGVRLGGLASRVVFGTDATVSTVHALATGAAIWAAFAQNWWLVGLCAIAGGVGYAVGGARWVRAYRGDPASHSRGESVLLLVVLAVPVVAGVVLLLAAS